MTVAPDYNRIFSFTNYQTSNPASPLPGTEVDAELNAIKASTDAVNANLQLIQRSDGQLGNATVGPQQLQASVMTGMNPPKQWSSLGVNYAVGDTVFSGLLFYVCNTANVSQVSNQPGASAVWTFLADFSGVTIPAGSITSAAFAAGAVNSAALGPGLALSSTPSPGDNSTAIATTAFVDTAIGSIASIGGGTFNLEQRTEITTGLPVPTLYPTGGGNNSMAFDLIPTGTGNPAYTPLLTWMDIVDTDIMANNNAASGLRLANRTDYLQIAAQGFNGVTPTKQLKIDMYGTTVMAFGAAGGSAQMTPGGALNCTWDKDPTLGQLFSVAGTFNTAPYTNSVAGNVFYAAGGAQMCGSPGNTVLFLNRTTSAGHIMEFANGSSIAGHLDVTASTVALTNTSDYRLKKSVDDVAGALDRVKSLRPVEYEHLWEPGVRQRGFIAHELQAVEPRAVTGSKDAVGKDGKPDYQSVNLVALIPDLIAAVKELAAQVDALKTK